MRVLVADASAQLFDGSYSPDGRWVAFLVVPLVGQPATNRIEIVPGTGGPRTIVVQHLGMVTCPRWAADGRSLYFLSHGTNGFLNLWAVPFDSSIGSATGKPRQLTHFSSPSRMIFPYLNLLAYSVNRNEIVLPVTETTGAIWMLNNVDR
jgi:Tol biopolymer transport system component